MSSDPSAEVVGVAPPAQPWPGDVEPVDPHGAPPPPSPGLDEELPNPPEPTPRRWRLAPRSLTGRLVTGVVSLVVLLVLVTGAGTYFALRSFLVDRLDQQVAQIADSNENVLAPCLARGFQTCPLGPASQSSLQTPLVEWLIVLDDTGAVTGAPKASNALLPLRLTDSQRKALAGEPSRKLTLRTTDGSKLRVAARTIPRAPDSSLTMVIGLSIDDVDRTMHRLLMLELVIGASAVVLALAATTYGVRFSLRRLYGVTRTAREVAAELSPDGAGLDRRVPVVESGTEVGQLAESMNTLLAAVETQFAARLANEQRMRQFLADASHELRTPLTSIRGYAELARMQRAQGALEPADNLERIESEGTRMSRLVDDLLTLARSDQDGQPQQREPVDIADVLDEAISGARAAFADRRIDVAAAPGLAVLGDRDQLLRVIRNLVTNAAVHTRPDGPISVDARREGADVVVRIVDAGPGLPADEAAHVFERFWRADKARSRVRGGSGLGLAIVASVVAAHGGSVSFESAVDTGSTVTVRLPVGSD
jgi:two-component system, OmpR family, sensor kinase